MNENKTLPYFEEIASLLKATLTPYQTNLLIKDKLPKEEINSLVLKVYSKLKLTYPEMPFPNLYKC